MIDALINVAFIALGLIGFFCLAAGVLIFMLWYMENKK